MSGVVLHLKKNDLGTDFRGWHMALYRHLAPLLQSEGIDLTVRRRDGDIRVGTRAVSDDRFDDGRLHIIDDRSLRVPHVLNAGVAYFWTFWHLDASGVKAFSSIGAEDFRPECMPKRRAEAFFANMQARYLAKRRSKYDQPDAVEDLPKGGVAVFFQGNFPMKSGASQLSDWQMLDQVLDGVGDCPVLVKPHPLANSAQDVARLERLAARDHRLVVTRANVHDLLRASTHSVSINSTVALEGFLHCKPAILFGQSDFHHFVSTVSPDLSFAEARAREAERVEGYAQYLAWYFLKNCLSLNSGKLDAEILERFARAGFSKARLRG